MNFCSPGYLCPKSAACYAHSPSPGGGLQTPHPASFPFSFLIWVLRCCLFSAPKLSTKPRLSPVWLCGLLWFPLWVLDSAFWAHLLAASLNRPSLIHLLIHSFMHSFIIHQTFSKCLLCSSVFYCALMSQRQIKYCPVCDNLRLSGHIIAVESYGICHFVAYFP